MSEAAAQSPWRCRAPTRRVILVAGDRRDPVPRTGNESVCEEQWVSYILCIASDHRDGGKAAASICQKYSAALSSLRGVGRTREGHLNINRVPSVSFSSPGELGVPRVGQESSSAFPCGHHAGQLPYQPPPHVPTQRCCHRPQQ